MKTHRYSSLLQILGLFNKLWSLITYITLDFVVTCGPALLEKNSVSAALGYNPIILVTLNTSSLLYHEAT